MKSNKTLLGAAIIPLILIIIALVYALSFSSAPVITPTNATTETPLVCTWTSDGATQTNVSWYNSSDLFSNVTNATSPQTLAENNTKKGETWNCTVIITDGSTITSSSDIQLIENALPKKPNATNRTLYEDTAYSIGLNATDPDFDVVTYIESTPSCDFDDFNQNTGVVTWTPTQNDSGNHTIVFQSSDDGGISAVGVQVVWEVIAVNDAPQFSPALSNQTATENTLFTYDINATDEENDTIYYYDNSSLFEINNLTGLINFTPSYAQVGIYSIEIIINDTVNWTTGTFTLTINATNHAPNLTLIQNYSIYQNQTISVNLTGEDFDNDTVNFSATADITTWFSVETINGSNIYQQINATGQINFTPTDDNVGNNSISVNITDSRGAAFTQNFTLEVININDYPNISSIANQSIAANVLFSLQVNGSDPDLDSGDSITYSDNTTIFNINSSSGLISFTPNGTYIGNYSINITVTDSFGLTNYTTFNLEIINNSVPTFNETPQNQTANEDSIFEMQINASDSDGDNITFADNTSIFDINTVTGLINFTPVQANVGNHSIEINITDDHGASNSTTFNLEIINVNDAPVLGSIDFGLMRVNLAFSYTVTATDEDVDAGLDDNITFYDYNSSIINISSNGVISFTPTEADAGNHSVNITVVDKYGLVDSEIVNFTIYNTSSPPNISRIYPYGTPISTITVFGWYDTSSFPNNITKINISENTTMMFNHSTSAPAENGELSFFWYYDDELVSTTNLSYNVSFNFTSSGNHNLTLKVNDTLAYETNFTWNISVSNKNRAPVLNESLQNISINTTTTYTDYLNKFYDPDGDNMSFSIVNSTTLATISISGDDVTFTPLNIGTAIIVFRATDGSLSVDSNNVTLNVTAVPEEETEGTTTGTGGGTTSRVIEVEVEVPKPVPLKIITPSEITMYKNNTVVTPITLVNRWNDTLSGGILLGAKTNATNVTFLFDRYYWDSIAIGANVSTNLTIVSYKSLPTYEIIITANVTNPDYQDTVSIFINSIEKGIGRYSEEVTNTKITFARDLLEGNPECIELNELLIRAQAALDEGNLEEANRLIDTTIQACKYLVNMAQMEIEKPSKIVIKLRNLFNIQAFNYALGALALILIAFGLLYIRKRLRKI